MYLDGGEYGHVGVNGREGDMVARVPVLRVDHQIEVATLPQSNHQRYDLLATGHRLSSASALKLAHLAGAGGGQQKTWYQSALGVAEVVLYVHHQQATL